MEIKYLIWIPVFALILAILNLIMFIERIIYKTKQLWRKNQRVKARSY
jgi:hypothetical protein